MSEQPAQYDAGSNALAIQVGGDHYKKMPIQPVEFALVNNLNTAQANIIKYACRHGSKDGQRDLRKAIHYCDLWLDVYQAHALPWRCTGRQESWPAVIAVADFVGINRLPDRVAEVVELICHGPTVARVKTARAVLVTMLMDFYGAAA